MNGQKLANVFNPDKTEIMIFSNVNIEGSIDFSFNGKAIPISTKHKHLDVTFSNDAKWNTYIENILVCVSKQLCLLRRLKYKLYASVHYIQRDDLSRHY